MTGPKRLLVLACVLVATLVSLLGGTAAPAGASDLPAIDLPGIPMPSIGCAAKGDPPMPASPYGDGSWIVRSTLAEAAIKGGQAAAGQGPSTPPGPQAGDPFEDPSFSLASTYGTTPQWWTYDAGCVGGVFAGIGAGLGNIGLQLAGILPNWSEALMDAVIAPGSWVGAIDAPVARTTQAIANGVWAPWLAVVLLLVAVLVMMRARGGHLAGSITAATWALFVLLVVSWVIQYPTESVHLVDAGVRNAVVDISSGFNQADQPTSTQLCDRAKQCDGATRESGQGDDASQQTALEAVDQQMDAIVRSTQYRTWLAGVFGDADSATARKYGPQVFRATHFTWGEYDTYRKDPGGQGKEILEAKQSSFKQLADQIKQADPVAYGYFTGSHWGARLGLVLMNGLVMLVVCGFLLMSALAILFSFALIRLVVPFAPAAGVLFMLDSVRDLAVGLLRKIVGPLVMGPVYFIVGLVLVRFEGQILTSQMWFVVKLALIAVLSWMAWRLTRPSAYGLRIPGLRGATQLAATFLGSRLGAKAGVENGLEVADATRAGTTGPRRTHSDAVVTGTGAHQIVHVPAQAPAGRTPLAVSGRDEWADWEEYGEVPPPPPSLELAAAARRDYDEPASAAGRHIVRPREVDEANLTYDEAGTPVFVLYTPDGDQAVPIDELNDRATVQTSDLTRQPAATGAA